MAPYRPPGEGRSKKLRLDLNENAVGCSPRVTAMLAQRINAEQLATYPEYEEVMSELAAYLKIGESEFLITNGADEAIQLLIHTYVDAGDSVILLRPSYSMYRSYGELAGARIVEVPYSAAGFEFPATGLMAALTPETRVVLIANPNNPTGTLADVSALDRILRAAPQAAVLVDEAYYEFSRVTMLDRIGEYPNLFITRTFSKAYGLAGMRCGCLFSASGNVDWLRKVQSPYSVNTLAAMAIRAAVQDVDHLNRCIEEILGARALLYEGLTRLGVRYVPSEANFVLFEAGKRAVEIHERLSERGVLIRGWSGEIPNYLRVTVGTQPQIRRFLQELETAWTR